MDKKSRWNDLSAPSKESYPAIMIVWSSSVMSLYVLMPYWYIRYCVILCLFWEEERSYFADPKRVFRFSLFTFFLPQFFSLFYTSLNRIMLQEVNLSVLNYEGFFKINLMRSLLSWSDVMFRLAASWLRTSLEEALLLLSLSTLNKMTLSWHSVGARDNPIPPDIRLSTLGEIKMLPLKG